MAGCHLIRSSRSSTKRAGATRPTIERFESEIQFTDKGPKSTVQNMLPVADGKNGVKIKLVSAYLSKKDPHGGEYNVYLQRNVNKNLSMVASGRLIVSFDGMADVAIPYNGWAKKKFYER
jgi:hypothetical protein